ncbi:MAG: hypothetical protein K2K52_05585 [Paramuribaculum sp.]|nr:hypothetical protein [Paramuribaculum sp.]
MKKFTFAIKWHEILKPYSDDIRREVYDAIIEYVATGTVIEMQPVSRMAFDFIRYEIDEKARRKEERLAKKKQKAIEKAQNTEPEEPYDPDKIAESYLSSGKLSTQLVVQSGKVAVIVSKEHIYGFVRRCVSEMLDRKLTPAGDEKRFTSTLHMIASNRLDIIRRDLKALPAEKDFTDEVWNSIVDRACVQFPKAAA